MNCENVASHMADIVAGTLRASELADARQHIERCTDCREALRGAEALASLKNRDTGEVPADLLDSITRRLSPETRAQQTGKRFWLGAGFGGAIAAAVFAAALTLGWLGAPVTDAPEPVEFLVALGEPRAMDIAIETDRPLQGATISIMLSGGVELDGYGGQRELSWTSDLSAGINRLSLPVIAVDEAGGRMVVRLSHPASEQMFVVQLKPDA